MQPQSHNFDSVNSHTNGNRCQPKQPINQQQQSKMPVNARNGSQQQNIFSHLQETFGPSNVNQQNPQSQQSQQQQNYYFQRNQQQQQAPTLKQSQQPQNLQAPQYQQHQQPHQQQHQQTPYPASQNQERQALQNKTNTQNNLVQTGGLNQQLNVKQSAFYVSNGGTSANTKSIAFQCQQRQSTPLKGESILMKQLTAKQIQSPGHPGLQQVNQQAMYSPLTKQQKQINENHPAVKSINQQGSQQQHPVAQSRSPQLMRINVPSNAQSNVQVLIDQLNKEKEKNQTLATKLKKLEFEQRGQNTQFLTDLEKRIKQLIHQNDTLQSLNQDLNAKLALNTHKQEQEELANQISQTKQQISQLTLKYQEHANVLESEKQKCDELETKLRNSENPENEEQQIKILVGDLEDKVQGLISENERLNHLIMDSGCDPQKEQQLTHLQGEKQKLSRMTNQNQKDIDAWKLKYEDLLKKFTKLDRGKVDIRIYNQQVEELEGQIRILIEENDELNNLVQFQIQNENQISELEEQMQNIVSENDKLEQELEHWRQQTEKKK